MNIEDLAERYHLTILPKNRGQQLVLKNPAKIIDYWPSSKKYIVRGTGERGVGLGSLLKYFEGPIAPPPPKPVVITKKKLPEGTESTCGCGQPAEVGVHGLRNREMHSRYYCNACYVRIYKSGCAKELDRLRQRD